jgi:hypothetical protein
VKNFTKSAVALKQTSFSSAEFAAKKRITRREQFLAEMEQVVPWAELEAVIAPPKLRQLCERSFNCPLCGSYFSPFTNLTAIKFAEHMVNPLHSETMLCSAIP